jgi:cytochrome bd ubiquinol oxidase subunit II
MLESTWFVLWGLLWAIYFMVDGFDFGIGMLVPFGARSEEQQQEMLRSVGPFWNGNEVWLITAGGVTFAAFPALYATLFAAFYTPLMLILFALIIRGVCLEFRHYAEGRQTQKMANAGIFLGSFLPALLFGVAFANIFAGIPLDARGLFQGNLLTLLNPYGLTGGILFVLLFLVHGALWAAWRSASSQRERLRQCALRVWFPGAAVAVLFLVLTAFYTRLWDNYLATPVLLVIPLFAVAALLYTGHAMYRGQVARPLVASFASIATCVLFGVVGLYPNMLPSTLDSAYGLTAHNAASGTLTLTIMLVVACIAIPCVILYQLWAYRLFLGKRPSSKDTSSASGG